MRRLVLQLVLAVCWPLAVAGQDLTPRERRQLDSLLRQDVPPAAPGVAAGIVRNGRILYAAWAGHANLQPLQPIDDRTRFNLASNGKQFTALAVLLLAEAGKLRLTDDIRRYLPELYPGIREPITVAHLLNHTSGIRDVYELWALQGITWWQHSLANADALALLRQQRELNFRPGTRYLYSNSNYLLLTEIVARAAGCSFVAYTNDLFRKLGMPNTSFEADYRLIREPYARPYFNFDTWTSYDWTTNLHGDGNLFSTLADQLTWEQLLQQGGSAALPAAVLARSQEVVAGAAQQQYGYGLEFGTYRNEPCRFHEGATGAWKATTLRFPARRLAIVTLTNSGKAIPALQTRQMADVLLGLPPETHASKPPPTGNPVPDEAIPGVYLNEANFWFQFARRPAGLFLVRAGRPDVRLTRAAPHLLQQADDPTFKLAFGRNSRGELQVTAYHPSHAPYTLTRPAADWAGVNPAALDGQYLNAETGVRLTVQHQPDRQYRLTLGEQSFTAVPVTPRQWLTDGYALDVGEGARGSRPALLLSSGRLQRVRFAPLP